jgi:two-component system nitrate/nitrite sensor histidine kinase NarX
MIFGTLWLSWKLEGAGAAINDTGSLRMRVSRLGLHMTTHASDAPYLVDEEVEKLEQVLEGLHRGNPARPLFLPTDTDVQAQMRIVTALWTDDLKPAIPAGLAGRPQAYLDKLSAFIAQTDHLVSLIETDNASKTTLLRMSQGVLIVIACAGALSLVYLLYLWIIVPVQQLQQGLQRMAAREFGVRLPVESRDEFGVLAEGFNRMAGELQSVYADLENRVKIKTTLLAEQNCELSALHDMAAFLNHTNEISTVCHGFLQRVIAQVKADGGSLRVIDPDGEKLHLVASEGLPETITSAEYCMKKDACFCGEATQQGIVIIKDFSKVRSSNSRSGYSCEKEGFSSLAVFRILNQDEVLGSFSLHFRQQHEVSHSETQLLDALGQQLGVALENRRLSAKARQLAVAEERNLVAQGLHDSIAQGLNYLNLQVQMLDAAVADSCLEEVRGIVPLLKIGVNESYQDVRELLANFREKLSVGELRAAVEDTVARFRRQSDIPVMLEIDDSSGAPLQPEQQLQVLFILQEALSNVRKHAQATSVGVVIRNARDFTLQVIDNGRGFDPTEVESKDNRHVGLSIMQERAVRLAAALDFSSHPGNGTTVTLTLPQQARLAA